MQGQTLRRLSSKWAAWVEKLEAGGARAKEAI